MNNYLQPGQGQNRNQPIKSTMYDQQVLQNNRKQNETEIQGLTNDS